MEGKKCGVIVKFHFRSASSCSCRNHTHASSIAFLLSPRWPLREQSANGRDDQDRSTARWCIGRRLGCLPNAFGAAQTRSASPRYGNPSRSCLLLFGDRPIPPRQASSARPNKPVGHSCKPPRCAIVETVASIGNLGTSAVFTSAVG